MSALTENCRFCTGVFTGGCRYCNFTGQVPEGTYRKREKPTVFRIELDREEDGRWIADCTWRPGVMAYGSTRGEAVANAMKLLDSVEAEEARGGE